MECATPTPAQATPRHFVTVLALLCVLVLAQSLAVVHAGDHLQHEADEICLAFHNVEKQPVLFTGLAFGPDPGAYDALRLAALTAPGGVDSTVFQARAPPKRQLLDA